MKQWSWIAMTALVGAAAAPAAQQGDVSGTTLAFLRGTCSALVVGGVDKTSECKASLINSAYKTGNSSFMFGLGDKAVVSFFGRDTAAVGDRATIHLMRVSVNVGGRMEDAMSSDVSGKCDYTNPYEGKAQIICEAEGKKGKFRAVFTSDGTPPHVIKL